MKNGTRLFASGLVVHGGSADAHLRPHVSTAELVEHARTIEHQIRKLDRRGAHITPAEEARAHVLKRLRLVVKDRLEAIQTN